MDDTLELDEEEELEEEADAEVDKVLFELTNGKLGEAGAVATELLVSEFWFPFVAMLKLYMIQSVQDRSEEEMERNMERYREQLNGLLSG